MHTCLPAWLSLDAWLYMASGGYLALYQVQDLTLVRFAGFAGPGLAAVCVPGDGTILNLPAGVLVVTNPCSMTCAGC